MINVGFITANHYPRLGGMEIAVHNLAKELHKLENVSSAVACSTMPEIPKNFSYPYPCHRAKSFSVFTPFLIQQNQKKMIKDNRINVLHGPMLHGGGYEAVQLSEKFNLPVVVHSRGSDVQVVESIGYGAQLQQETKKKLDISIAKANKIIAVSQINKNDLLQLGAKEEHIKVIPNGIFVDEINAVPFQDLRSKLGLAPDDFVLITVGRNRPIKRMELLFEALQHLKEFKKIKCLCVGPKENLGQLAEKFNVSERVILAGRIPNKANFNMPQPYSELINAYRSSDVYVSTSYVESFGNAAADALACGIPIFVGKKHGVIDIIKEGNSGWIMHNETPKAIADQIIELYNSRESIKTKSDEVKASVKQLTWHNIAKQTLEVYKDIL